MTRRSWRAAGRLVPPPARLHSRSVRLARGACMAWHTTGRREELLIMLEGRLVVEARAQRRRMRRWPLVAGRTLFLPPRTEHRVLQTGAHPAHYIYVTG